MSSQKEGKITIIFLAVISVILGALIGVFTYYYIHLYADGNMSFVRGWTQKNTVQQEIQEVPNGAEQNITPRNIAKEMSTGDTVAITAPTELENNTPRCENGILDEGEECDDGNADHSDACTRYCQKAVCGDGIVYASQERCDDGNNVSGDGCSEQCVVEVITDQCGDAVNTTTCTVPTQDLCGSGDASVPNIKNATWLWKCGERECSAQRQCGYINTNSG